MKRFIWFLVVVFVAVVGVGFYRDWFKLGSTSGDGKTDITLTVHTDKVGEDWGKVKNLVRPAKDDAVAPTDKNNTPAALPEEAPRN
jgi:hypothetical protein